jgi:hypothetical protein
MQKKRPLWLLSAVLLSTLWVGLIFALVANALVRAPSFKEAASVPCSQFLLPIAATAERALQRVDSRLFFPLVRWQDARSGETISTFRKGEQALSCETIEQRAKLFLMGERAGAIIPKVSVNLRGLAFLLGIPCCLFMIGFYILFARKSSVQPSPAFTSKNVT